ncbi:MAG: hypothetical protein IJ757_04340 [Clostridiales bacterium]|nr:hypothetical protein [Clostridiales bacterium]
MRKLKRGNKRGTSTIFLAIVLSSLILVETTYIALVADLDRRLTYTRALKEQTEVYLASYDRQLFKTYGIYAFNSSGLDSYVFDEVLAANGYASGDVMYVSGIYSFDTEQLRRAVATYYSYRASGVIIQRFSSQIMALTEQLGLGEVIERIREFTSSPAAGIISRIIDGGSETAEAISSALETLGLDESSYAVQQFTSLFSSLGALNHDSPDMGNGFDPSDMSFIFDLLEFNSQLYEVGSDFNETINMHGCLCDYAARNFDCFLEDDTAINGTSYSVFHSDNESDAEYILTGLEGLPGRALTDYYIFGVLFLKCLVMNVSDPVKHELYMAISDILMLVVSGLTGGVVTLPPEVYELVILIIASEIEAVSELVTVLNGGGVSFLNVGDTDVLTMEYRDFLSVFMNLVPDSLLLTRMLNIFNRDYPDYVTGISTEVDYRGETIAYEAAYELYA